MNGSQWIHLHDLARQLFLEFALDEPVSDGIYRGYEDVNADFEKPPQSALAPSRSCSRRRAAPACAFATASADVAGARRQAYKHDVGERRPVQAPFQKMNVG